MIREFAPRFLMGPGNHAFQVKSVLSKLLLCRTKTLGGHTYVCRPCGTSCEVYNSCGDRHCPGHRPAWMPRWSMPGLDALIGWTRRAS
ncbi:MAG: transposase zinc-binding domain-containing protein [Planctomycetaceae bacterium]|nr:transposase zinc-binding domain-containing protein [Planctomycetaceae bacterium]MCB9922540.1 transposase zinc-binding domain-containing protein [Planctomycetaceae bacterium]MCB9925886.1 transposase zinc-binding domain-containing protein [Planctomycetaceae bacterium]